jgi:hypothetical protein
MIKTSDQFYPASRNAMSLPAAILSCRGLQRDVPPKAMLVTASELVQRFQKYRGMPK